MASSPQYITLISVKNSPCNEHMTIAFHGEDFPVFTEKDFNRKFPTKCRITGDLLLGENKTLAAWSVEPDNYDSVFYLWKKYNIEQKHTQGLVKPTLHITKKKDSPKREVGDIIEFDYLYLKQVGERNQFFTLKVSGE